MSQYKDLDDMIIKRLKTNPATFTDLMRGDIRKECDTIASLSVRGESFRVLDCRLQSLRKSGRIFFDRMVGWRLK